MKKTFSIIMCLSLILTMCIGLVPSASAAQLPDYVKPNMLYVHAVDNETESDSYLHWQRTSLYRDYDDDDLSDLGVTIESGISEELYFFLPSGITSDSVSILNTYSTDVTVGTTVIPAGRTANFKYNTIDTFNVSVGDTVLKLKFMKSTAEAAVFVNNADPDGNGTDLYEYLSASKSNSTSATGAIVNRDGSFDNTPIKKIKGRGNTTWLKTKKPFNITYSSAVSIDSMEATKKLSLLANYQDASLIRNRFLYDLSGEVGMPYASASRFVDLYMNGEYLGSYQLAQKVDTGKNNLVPEIKSDSHLNADGSLRDEFPFLVEVDSSAGDGDYWISSSASRCKLTVKGPELEVGDAYYNEILQKVKTKFDAMHAAIRNNSANLSELVDIDSLAKIMLINELGKNWDVGISSLYFVYKADESGNYKFFASPVWDYDNSLGNATGSSWELNSIGVKDYEEPTGWWVKHKPGMGSGKAGKYTILGFAARNSSIMKYASQVWFNEFVPAIDRFNNNTTEHRFSNAYYYSSLKDSAEMNYTLGWRLNTGGWICDHSTLTNGYFNSETGKFIKNAAVTKYDLSTFKGEYDYTVDWMNTRAAWLSEQFYPDYDGPVIPSVLLLGDANLDNIVDIKDATLIQKCAAEIELLSEAAAKCADVNSDNTVNITDATAVQKYCAGVSTGFNIGKEIN